MGENISINQVSGATVADWEIKNGELTVKLLEPADHNVRFVVSCETRLPRDGQITVPIFAVENNLRQTGGVAVEVLGAGEIKDAKGQGLEEADSSDLGPMASKTNDVIGGFNAYIAGLSEEDQVNYLFSLTLFDTQVAYRHVAIPLSEVAKLNSKSYQPEGNTALNDAIGITVRKVEADQPKVDKVVTVIMRERVGTKHAG